jgi:biotin transport system ATP-binding protein
MAGQMAARDQGIVLSGAGVAIRGKAILSDLTLTLSEGRIGIIGQNGSGKTTLLRLIAGLIAPTSGNVAVDGIDPARDRKAMLSRIGILFQNPDRQILFPTVAEELAFGLSQQGHKDAEARARAALAAEGRADWADLPTSTLSQGQRQWLCLQAVLLMAPRTILLDEPFAALDLPTAARLSRRLSTLPQRLITISHSPAAVATCDRLLWLEAGRLRADGPPATLLPAFTAEMTRLGEADADPHLPR